jgi:simple sugar transport system substrate-binding protein
LKKTTGFIILLTFLALVLAACGATQEPTSAPAPATSAPEPTAEQAESPQPAEAPQKVESASSPEAQPVPEQTEPTAEPVAVSGGELRFVFVQHALCAWDSYWCEVEDGIRRAAEDLQVDATILGPDQFDLDQVAALIDQAVESQPDGLAVTIPDLDRLREPIQRALDAGVPIVAYNSGAGPTADHLDYLTYLGSDESQGGYLSAIRLADAGGTKGVCINHQVGHAGLDARCEGFLSAVDIYDLPAEILSIGADPVEAQASIADYYAANPDTDFFLTLGPSGASPFYAFLEAQGIAPGTVKHGTFDLSEEIAAHIKDGTTLFAIDQQPFLQGYGAVQTLMLRVRYGIEPVLDVTPTGPNFVDTNSIDFETDADRPVNLAFVQHALCLWDTFWCHLEAGINQAAADMHVDVTIQGPEQFDLDQVAALIDTAVAAQPDGLAVTMTDPEKFREPVQRALDAGLPVISYNTGSGPLVDAVPYLTYVGMDRSYNYQGGYLGATALAQGGGTRGVCINHQVGNTALDARCEGFINAMSENGIPAEVLEVTNDHATTLNSISEYYAAHPDLDIVMTLGPQGAVPFYGFLSGQGLGPDAIKHGTFDFSLADVERLKDGTTEFVVHQQPFLQGYNAVSILMLKIRHGINPVLPVTPSGPVLIDANNVDAAAALYIELEQR